MADKVRLTTPGTLRICRECGGDEWIPILGKNKQHLESKAFPGHHFYECDNCAYVETWDIRPLHEKVMWIQEQIIRNYPEQTVMDKELVIGVLTDLYRELGALNIR